MSDEPIKDESEKNEEVELTPLEKCLAESELYKTSWQRALADYQNLLKETAQRRNEWAQMSELQILEEFLPVYDHFKVAFAHHPALDNGSEEHKKIQNWVDGIGYIMKQFGEILKSHKIEEIKTVGEQFDPHIHESAGEEPASTESTADEGTKPGTILKEVSGGYKMGDRVIKPARVIICK